MLNPKELKGVTFKKNLGGSYNASEVDDFLAGLIDDYTKIYTDNAELSMKLELMAERLAAYKGQEQKLRTAVANVKLLCDNLIKDANEKSEKIVKTAMAERDSIVAALEDTVRQKRSEIETINASVAEYKENMIFKYKMHIDAINSLPLFDDKASEELIEKSEERLEKLKIREQEIPVLLNEKKEVEEEVAEFIEPTEPKEVVSAPTVTQEQQIIKAKVVGTRKIDSSTTVFERPVVKPEKATSEPTVVFDSKEVIKKAKETKKAFVVAKEEAVPEEKPVEGQTTFDEVEPEIKNEPAAEYVKPTEEILQNFAPKEEKIEVVEVVEEKKEEPKIEEDEIDAPAFLKNRRKPRSAEQEKKSIIESIKISVAEKEAAERLRIEQEEAEEKEMQSIAGTAVPIVDEEEEEIIPVFDDGIKFGNGFDIEDDDDDDDDDDGFFSFFKSK